MNPYSFDPALLEEKETVVFGIYSEEEKTVRYGYFLSILFGVMFLTAAILFAIYPNLWVVWRVVFAAVSFLLAGFFGLSFWVFRLMKR